MLINVRVSELFTTTNNSIPLAIIVLGLFSYLLYDITPYSVNYYDDYSYINFLFNGLFLFYKSNTEIFFAVSKI